MSLPRQEFPDQNPVPTHPQKFASGKTAGPLASSEHTPDPKE